jgi:HEAT repeat protein
VRRAAVLALAKNFPDDPDTKTFLKDRATQDDNYYVRRAAVSALAENFKDDPDTKTFLKDRATQDDKSGVRGAAVQALGEKFPDDPQLFAIYYNCAVNDPFEGSHDRYKPNPRRVALEIIIKQFPQHPDTLPLLRDRAENDADEVVRGYAEKQLREWENK